MSETRSIDLDKFRGRLLEERKRLNRLLARPDGDGRSGDEQAEATSELSDYPDHPADQATETFDREVDQSVRQNARDLLEKVEDALRKMEAGTYGICSNCNKPIPERRLDVMPSAIYCVPCQSAIEGG